MRSDTGSVMICYRCHQPKDSSEFPVINRQGVKATISNVCRSCTNKRTIPSFRKWKFKNHAKIALLKKNKMRRDSKNLTNAYIKHCLRRKFSKEYLNEHPEMIELKRLQLQLSRSIETTLKIGSNEQNHRS